MKEVTASFLGNNNIKIYSKKNIVDNPRANVVIVHGICEHLDRYDYLTNKLNHEGYNVFRFDLRGHGRSEGKRGDLINFEDFLIDLDHYINKVKEEYPNLKLVLLGHSMGGLIATSYACMFSSKIDFLVLSGAANKTPKKAKPLKLVPLWLTKFINYKNILGKGVCSDTNVVKAYNNDPLVLKVTKLRLLKNALINGCKLVNNNINNITVPTLVMHGKDDGIVESSIGEWTYSHLVVNDKELKMYDGLYHEIFNEIKKDEVINDLINWLNQRIER